MADALTRQRNAVNQMRDEGELGNEAFRRFQRGLDREQERLPVGNHQPPVTQHGLRGARQGTTPARQL
jgi:hypothetical protein